MHIAVGEQPAAFLKGDVGVAFVVHGGAPSRIRPSESPALCYNRSAFPNPEPLLPDFFAFAGLRYDCGAAGTDLEALAAPPYDVIDEDQRAALEAAAPHNAVRLLLPRDEQRRR